MKKLLIINALLLCFLFIAVALYIFKIIDDTTVAFCVIPIFVYFVIVKEKIVIKPTNQMRKDLWDKADK